MQVQPTDRNKLITNKFTENLSKAVIPYIIIYAAFCKKQFAMLKAPSCVHNMIFPTVKFSGLHGSEPSCDNEETNHLLLLPPNLFFQIPQSNISA